MAEQQHRVLRQVIELAGCPLGTAREAQSLMRDHFRRELLPAIERIFDEMAPTDRLHRIDRMVIDLGVLPPDGAPTVLTERLNTALAPQLAVALQQGGAVESDLELFTYLVQTGSLPWWAERSVRDLPARTVQRLLAQSPQRLALALRQLGPDASCLRRIALMFADAELESMLGLLLQATPAPASLAGLGASAPLLLAAEPDAAAPARQRADWWFALLRAALSGPPRSAAALLQAALAGLLPPATTRRERSLAHIEIELERGALAMNPALQDLWREAVDLARRPAPAAPEALRRLLAAWAESGTPGEAARLWATLSHELEALPPALLARAGQAVGHGPGDDAAAAIAALVASALQLGRLRAQVVESVAARSTSPLSLPGWPDALADGLRAQLRHAAAAVSQPPAPIDLAFSASESLYIGNAGLVLLWPFIGSLFRRLNLVVDNAFVTSEAAQRGVGLLHYLGTGEREPPEHAVALNKLLCGLPAEAVFEFGEPMSDAEAEECDDMLQAAIAQAPILHEMSVAGFRGSFLLREGQLGARDERWLLRVERQTWDVVLDRFPWGFGLVKLPWMQAMLQVEW